MSMEGTEQHTVYVQFGPGPTEEASVQLASDALTIIKRDFPLVFATAMARAWGIDLPTPTRARRGKS